MTEVIPRGQTPAMRAYQKAYRAANPRDRRAYKAAYDAANAEKNAAYRAANKDRQKAVKAAYYQANRDRLLAAVAARAAAKPEAISKYHAQHYERNAERIKANVLAYRCANPEKKRHLENRRRTRKASNGGSHTLDQWLAKLAETGGRCFYCGCDGKMTRDHKTPLKRGGTDDIENIAPACQSCNSRKHDKTAEEYLARTNHAAIGGIGLKAQSQYMGR